MAFSSALLIVWGLLASVNGLGWILIDQKAAWLVLFLWVLVATAEYIYNLAHGAWPFKRNPQV